MSLLRLSRQLSLLLAERPEKIIPVGTTEDHIELLTPKGIIFIAAQLPARVQLSHMVEEHLARHLRLFVHHDCLYCGKPSVASNLTQSP